MHDIWESPAWQSLGSFSTTSRNLTFSYYIDWFNPFTNKQAGKHVSCGAILLFCLNLPPEMRHLSGNMYIQGLTLLPKEPDIVTITHVAQPLMDKLKPFFSKGTLVRTCLFPASCSVCVAVVPFIADILGICKGGGFASHSANLFCSFCWCHRNNIKCVDHTKFRMWQGLEVTADAHQWLDTKTKVARDALFKVTGIRWSALHHLWYRNPVQHTVLGIMHNWAEGVLQHHVHCKLGLGGIVPSREDHDVVEPEPELLDGLDESDEAVSQADMTEAGSDLASLFEEALNADDAMIVDQESLGPYVVSGNESNNSDSVPNDPDSDNDAHEAKEEKKKARETPCVFNKTELAAMHAGLADIVLPTCVDRPPTNLGKKSHRKLKADNWIVLFTFMLPMSVLELWHDSGSAFKKGLLQNLEYLVLCTHIVCSFATSIANANAFDHYYVLYCCGLHTLFPKSGSVPNHHYAMHIGWLLKFWGPLMAVAEFAYEWINGLLQKSANKQPSLYVTTAKYCTFSTDQILHR
jgi:hypothetical protein